MKDGLGFKVSYQNWGEYDNSLKNLESARTHIFMWYTYEHNYLPIIYFEILIVKISWSKINGVRLIN